MIKAGTGTIAVCLELDGLFSEVPHYGNSHRKQA
jgi:hypothetical protein